MPVGEIRKLKHFTCTMKYDRVCAHVCVYATDNMSELIVNIVNVLCIYGM
jgi:hypothetical protein